MKQKPLSAIEFEQAYPDIQTRTAKISQLRVKTLNLPVNTGTVQLPNSGDITIQTNAGSAVLVLRSGTVNYYFNSAGTL